jgi:hypothetical protein
MSAKCQLSFGSISPKAANGRLKMQKGTEEIEITHDDVDLERVKFNQLLAMQVKLNLIEDRFIALERTLNWMKIGGGLVLLIMICHYLAERGWL